MKRAALNTAAAFTSPSPSTQRPGLRPVLRPCMIAAIEADDTWPCDGAVLDAVAGVGKYFIPGSRQSGGTPPLGEVYAPQPGGRGGSPMGGGGTYSRLDPEGGGGVPHPCFTYAVAKI
jgi:hypothetical protein